MPTLITNIDQPLKDVLQKSVQALDAKVICLRILLLRD